MAFEVIKDFYFMLFFATAINFNSSELISIAHEEDGLRAGKHVASRSFLYLFFFLMKVKRVEAFLMGFCG